MRKALGLTLIFCLAFVQPSTAVGLSAITTGGGIYLQDSPWEQPGAWFSAEQLENLLAPIALYPDPLLAQVLVAATFPDQVDEAARTLRANNSLYNVDATSWDMSVKAIAHYPSVLFMMADKLDWTTSLGQAYVNQSTEVMEAVQRLRRQARNYGYLTTTQQQQIVDTDGYLYIYPAQPQYLYVPVYDPGIVFFPRRPLFTGAAIWFGAGLIIGAWLNHDCDWQHHRVFYHGWERGPAWVQRSRPFIHPTNIYVNPSYSRVAINRGVVDRRVNYGALNRYNAIHRDTDFSRVRRSPGAPVPPVPPAQANHDNKIIRRNIDIYDSRINANRGHEPPSERRPEGGPPQARVPEINRNIPPGINRNIPPPAVNVPPRQPETRPDIHRPERPSVQTPPPGAQQHGQIQMPQSSQGQIQMPQRSQGQIQMPQRSQGNVPMQRPGWTVQQPPPMARTNPPSSPVFRPNPGTFDPRDASRRGETSRQNSHAVGAAGAGAGPRSQTQNAPPSNRPNAPSGRRPR